MALANKQEVICICFGSTDFFHFFFNKATKTKRGNTQK